MNRSLSSRRSLPKSRAKAGVVALAVIAASVATVGLADATGVRSAAAKPLSFHMVTSSSSIKACLPRATGHVTVTPGSTNDTMKVTISGLPSNIGFDLFVTQQPTAPFGVSGYQSDIKTGATGTGTTTVRGVFDSRTFSVSVGGTTTFAPTHQYHLGLWFNSAMVPFKIGCEPGATSPIVTPFNANQHAGIQVLNTSNFPVNAGPLSKLSR
jgi:hypothetical protein